MRLHRADCWGILAMLRQRRVERNARRQLMSIHCRPPNGVLYKDPGSFDSFSSGRLEEGQARDERRRPHSRNGFCLSPFASACSRRLATGVQELPGLSWWCKGVLPNRAPRAVIYGQGVSCKMKH